MTFHALVVDDNPAVLEDIKDRLEALDHTYDCAGCLQDAREYLADNRYSYVLLDLEIPVRYGRPSRISNGQELLREIRSIRYHKETPIIVITAHGHDSPDLVIEVLRCDGASDFVKKPFTDNRHSLERAIYDNLAACGRLLPGAVTCFGALKSDPPRSFEAGELLFYESRVELCGVKICGGPECGVKRRVLDKLRQKNSNGKFISYSGNELAAEVGCDQGQNGVANAVRNLRDHVYEAMLTEVNLRLDRCHDFIINDRCHGYRFSHKITIRDAKDPADTTGDMINGFPNDLLNVLTFNKRQQWILEQLQTGIGLRKSELIARFHCSESTAARDLRELRLHKIIEFFGTPKDGYWRLV
jgi:CheY-like chemotaxis protein